MPHDPVQPARAPNLRPRWVGWSMLFVTILVSMLLVMAATVIAVFLIVRR